MIGNYVEERFLRENGYNTNANSAMSNTALEFREGNPDIIPTANYGSLESEVKASYQKPATINPEIGDRRTALLRKSMEDAKASLKSEQLAEAAAARTMMWTTSTRNSYGSPIGLHGGEDGGANDSDMEHETISDEPITVYSGTAPVRGQFGSNSLFTTPCDRTRVDKDDLIATGKL